MKMIQYDTYGGYIRMDKIAWVYNQRNGHGVVIISEDGKESRGNMTAGQVIQQMSSPDGYGE